MENIKDYTTGVFTSEYEKDGAKYCFTVYPKYYLDETGLHFSGNEMVLAITPNGTIFFSLSFEDSNWKIQTPDQYLDAFMSEGEKKAATKLEKNILDALEVLQLRIKHTDNETLGKKEIDQDYLNEVNHRTFKQVLTEISKEENKFNKSLPMGEVVKHFRVLTERKSKNGKPFLTPEQLISFLQKGFLGKQELPKQKINYANTEKGLVILRFYELFLLAVTNYGEKNSKSKYINLVLNCFDNWDKKSIEAFFKPNRIMQKW
jgi:hypothetical protein